MKITKKTSSYDYIFYSLQTSAAVLNADDDDVSYDMPHELYDDYAIQETNVSASIYGSAQLEPPPPSSDNQSTPKKPNQRFTTKVEIFVDSY